MFLYDVRCLYRTPYKGSRELSQLSKKSCSVSKGLKEKKKINGIHFTDVCWQSIREKKDINTDLRSPPVPPSIFLVIYYNSELKTIVVDMKYKHSMTKRRDG